MLFKQKLTNDEYKLLPWYKQFWPWFIMALPMSAVIAGLITVYIAFDNKDSLVYDDYYKRGLAINNRIHEQEKAHDLGYSALLKRLPNNRLVVAFDNAVPDEEQLDFNWIHPFKSDRDFHLILIKQDDGTYQTTSEINTEGRWYLQISSKDNWTLKSEIDNGIFTAHLSPQLN